MKVNMKLSHEKHFEEYNTQNATQLKRNID